MSRGRPSPSGPGRWVSASELADYAYCPRSWWYRDHPPPGGVSRADQARSRSGTVYHHRVLGAERRREAWAGAIAAVAVLATVALLVLLLFGDKLP